MRDVIIKVIAFLGWTEDRFAQYQYDCGITYLEKIAAGYPQVISQISRTKTFWTWWKNHWTDRDKTFIECMELAEKPEETAELIYQEMHDPRTLAEAIYLTGQVLQESYAALISEITDEQHNDYKPQMAAL